MNQATIATNHFVELPKNVFTDEPSDIQYIISSGGSVKLLWRSCYEELRIAVEAIHSQQFGKSEYVFSGPGGAGKSCMLFALAHYSAQVGFLVLYIASADRLCSIQDISLAKHLIQLIKKSNEMRWPKSYPSLDISGLNDTEICTLAVRIIECMKFSSDYPCLIAIDQWNVVSASDDMGKLFKQLFGTFNSCRVTYGACFLAVSSSFSWPSTLFKDADEISHRLSIPLYTMEELSIIANDLRNQSKLPPIGRGFDDGAINSVCGKVGRMLAFATKVWREKPSEAWGNTHFVKLDGYATKYYAKRVMSLLSKVRGDAVTVPEQRQLVNYIAMIFLNKHNAQTIGHMPRSWEWIGLFDTDSVPPVPVCRAVTNGIDMALFESKSMVLQFLADDPDTIGRSLELFVAYGLRDNIPRDFTLHCTTLSGFDANSLKWHISNVRVQSCDNPLAVFDTEIVNGTLIICCAGHAVVDMVLYSGGLIFFIQISMSSYLIHSTGADELFTCTPTKSIDVVVYNYYQSRAPPEWQCPSFTKIRSTNIWKKMQYVYITPDSTHHRKRSSVASDEHVLRVSGDNLRIFGDNFRLFVKGN